jgi:hypothetical protein
MPLFFVPLLGLMGIGIALFRRTAQAPADLASEDVAARLLRWAVGLLSPQRAEWGQAMLGELGHLEGRIRRLRFTLGCVIASLLLPPWGRAAAGVWVMVAVVVGSLSLHATVVVRYGLGAGDWVTAVILVAFLVGFLLAASALLRRPGVAGPGLVGGAFVALAWLTLSGFTLDDQIAPDIVPWHPWVITIVVPFVVGAAGTLYSRDPIVGKRVARLAGITAGLGLCLYGILAVAVVGAGGPPDDSGWGVRAIVSDRLDNTLIVLLLLPMVTATVGWGGAAAATALTPTARGRVTANVPSAPLLAAGQTAETGGAAAAHAQQVGSGVRGGSGRRTARLLLLGAVVVAALIFAAAAWIPG